VYSASQSEINAPFLLIFARYEQEEAQYAEKVVSI
jgi:hypothetical protein